METVSYSHNNIAKEVGLGDPASAKQLVCLPKCSFNSKAAKTVSEKQLLRNKLQKENPSCSTSLLLVFRPAPPPSSLSFVLLHLPPPYLSSCSTSLLLIFRPAPPPSSLSFRGSGCRQFIYFLDGSFHSEPVRPANNAVWCHKSRVGVASCTFATLAVPLRRQKVWSAKINVLTPKVSPSSVTNIVATEQILRLAS